MVIIAFLVAGALFAASAWRLSDRRPCLDETLRYAFIHNEKFTKALVIIYFVASIVALALGTCAFFGIAFGLAGLLQQGVSERDFALLGGGLVGALLCHHLRGALAKIGAQIGY